MLIEMVSKCECGNNLFIDDHSPSALDTPFCIPCAGLDTDAEIMRLVPADAAPFVPGVKRPDEETVTQESDGVGTEWELAGEIGVDAGLCMIGDPCYHLHAGRSKDSEDNRELPAAFGKTWGEFCSIIWDPERGRGPGELYNAWMDDREAAGLLGGTWEDYVAWGRTQKPPKQKPIQFNYDKGHPGLAVVCHTGYGDGMYPVYVKYGDKGRVAEMKVVFMNSKCEICGFAPCVCSEDELECEACGFVVCICTNDID